MISKILGNLGWTVELLEGLDELVCGTPATYTCIGVSKFHFSSPKNNEFEFDEIVPTSNVLKPLVICSQSLKTGNWIHLITGIGEDL